MVIFRGTFRTFRCSATSGPRTDAHITHRVRTCCSHIEVFLWWCGGVFCGGVNIRPENSYFTVFRKIVVMWCCAWWCGGGDVVLVVKIVVMWCCGGVVVVMWCCWCTHRGVFVVVWWCFLWWCQHPARELVLYGVSQDCGDVVLCMVVWWW